MKFEIGLRYRRSAAAAAAALQPVGDRRRRCLEMKNDFRSAKRKIQINFVFMNHVHLAFWMLNESQRRSSRFSSSFFHFSLIFSLRITFIDYQQRHESHVPANIFFLFHFFVSGKTKRKSLSRVFEKAMNASFQRNGKTKFEINSERRKRGREKWWKSDLIG